MPAPDSRRSASEPASPYTTWQVGPARAGDCVVQVASKPGVFAHGSADPAAFMLAEAIVGARDAADGGAVGGGALGRSLHLSSGNGFVPAVAAQCSYQPIALDRYQGNVDASRRTLHDVGTAVVEHAAIAGALVPDGSCTLVTIRIPTDKLGVQLAIAEAFRVLAPGGTCRLAGANDEGAKPAAKLLERVFGHARLDAQHSSHRLLTARKLAPAPRDPEAIASPWLDEEHFHTVPTRTGGTAFTLYTRPGVFSWQHLDEATDLLAGVMRIDAGERVLDLGCGAGVLGVVAARQGASRVLMLDADADAVRCATRTAQQAKCTAVEVRASDVAQAAGDERFDVVVSNPPFHLGKGTDLHIPRAFITQSYDRLLPGGRLYLVANRTLPYEWLIEETFGEVRTAHDGQRFKVIGAVRRD